jgi:transposase
MARKLDNLGPELAAQIERAWARRDLEDWQRKRLLVVRLIAQHRLDAKAIAEAAGVSRASVFNYRDKLVAGGVNELLSRDWAGARRPAVRGPVAKEFEQALEQGTFRQAKDAQAWIAKRTRKKLTVSGAWKVLRRLGGKLETPRKSHAKKDQAKSHAFNALLAERLAEVAGTDERRGRVWVLDEHR